MCGGGVCAGGQRTALGVGFQFRPEDLNHFFGLGFFISYLHCCIPKKIIIWELSHTVVHQAHAIPLCDVVQDAIRKYLGQKILNKNTD